MFIRQSQLSVLLPFIIAIKLRKLYVVFSSFRPIAKDVENVSYQLISQVFARSKGLRTVNYDEIGLLIAKRMSVY